MMNQQIREDILKLMQQKDVIESEIKNLTAILNKNGVGLSEPLVDEEGFPISNIDIYQVRHARHKIIYLQNDHKALMKEIENGLHKYYGSTPVNNGHTPIETEMKKISITHTVPFAKITFVNPGSPAECANLCANDLIVEFGSVNSSNFRNITDVASVVQYSEGQRVTVKVKREHRYVTTDLVPQKWSGRGLIGCNIECIQ